MIYTEVCFVVSAASFEELSFLRIAKASHNVEIEAAL